MCGNVLHQYVVRHCAINETSECRTMHTVSNRDVLRRFRRLRLVSETYEGNSLDARHSWLDPRTILLMCTEYVLTIRFERATFARQFCGRLI